MNFSAIRMFLISRSRGQKLFFLVMVDCLLAIFTTWSAFAIRLGEISSFLPLGTEFDITKPILVAVLLGLITNQFFGAYEIVNRLLSFESVVRAIKAYFGYSIVYIVIFSIVGVSAVPKTIGVIQPFLLLTSVIVVRLFAYGFLSSVSPQSEVEGQKQRILVYGAGHKGRALAQAVGKDPNFVFLGFVDDDPSLEGRTVGNSRVFSPRKLKSIFERLNCDEILVAKPDRSGEGIVDAVGQLIANQLPFRIVPDFKEANQNNGMILEEVDLGLEELLGRKLVLPKPDLISLDIRSKCVFVSGAGGSIGSELCRQVLHQRPNKLVLFELSEPALYEITSELNDLNSKAGPKERCQIVGLLGSVLDGARVDEIFKLHCPDTVYHAAAYKHVPIIEENWTEGFKNNSLGTLRLAELAISHGIEKFVLVSTDKAVRPTSLMGVSKRIAELAIQHLSRSNHTTNFSIVRFGNVINSSGSVIPLFKRQLKTGQKLTVTDTRATRYFMAIPEAAELVIQAGAINCRKPDDDAQASVYLLDMGEPVKIIDLAVKMLALASNAKDGTQSTQDAYKKIEIIGLRPGEKLHEELTLDGPSEETIHPKIRLARETMLDEQEVAQLLNSLENAVSAGDYTAMANLIEKGFPKVRLLKS